LLKWSVRELSDQCRISQSAIAHSEQVAGTPPMRVQNLAAIRRLFEERGIEFRGLDGVRLLTMSQSKAPAVNREAKEDWGGQRRSFFCCAALLPLTIIALL